MHSQLAQAGLMSCGTSHAASGSMRVPPRCSHGATPGSPRTVYGWSTLKPHRSGRQRAAIFFFFLHTLKQNHFKNVKTIIGAITLGMTNWLSIQMIGKEALSPQLAIIKVKFFFHHSPGANEG